MVPHLVVRILVAGVVASVLLAGGAVLAKDAKTDAAAATAMDWWKETVGGETEKSKWKTRVESAAAFSKEDAAKLPALATVLPNGGVKVAIANDRIDDVIEVYVDGEGRVAAAIGVER